MIGISQSGNFNHIEKFLINVKQKKYIPVLSKYGKKGIDALASATPIDSGKTASSWNYEIQATFSGINLYFTNENINKGVNIAIILQYGHGTRNGGYVVGRDYINPAIRPIFDSIANDLWKEITSL